MLVALVLAGRAGPVRGAPRPRVLVLASYHLSYRWTADVNRGVVDALVEAGADPDFSFEFMDTKRFPGAEHLAMLEGFYRTKYSGQPFDLIVASDNNALDFLRRCRDDLFPGVPVVFCGVNFLAPRDLEGMDDITGVSEEADFAATIDLILSLHPRVRRLVAVTDTTTTGRRIRSRLVPLLETYGDRFEWEVLDDLPMASVVARLQGLPADAAVLYTLFFRDGAGVFHSYRDSAARIAAASPVPVYGGWDFSLGSGVVGGRLVSGYEQGLRAGALAARVLAGEPTAEIPKAFESPNRYVFDYRALKRFGIDPGSLPPGSRILFEPDTFYYRYRKGVWAGAALFVAQTGIIVALFLAVSRRRRSERARAESEARYRGLFESAPVGLLVVDGDGRMVDANPRAADILGYGHDQLLGLLDKDIVHPDDLAARPRVRPGEVATPGVVVDFERRYRRLDGQYVSVDVQVSGFGPDRILVAFQDVGDRKRAEAERDQLRQRVLQGQKLEAVGTLAGGIAHDFNNILGGMLGYADLALESTRDDRLRAYLERIVRGGERAAQIVRQILAFSRNTVEDRRVIALGPLVKEAMELLRASIPSTIEVETRVEANCPGVVADPGQMHQVVMNLVTNARQAMGETGGRLMVDLRRAWAFDGPAVELVVSDTGPGIDPDQRERIFEPYFTTKGVGEGSGLGLSVVHGIVEAHGGTVDLLPARSSRGACFRVLLPAARIHPEEPESEAIPLGRGERVYLVDDEPDLVAVGRGMLEGLGYSVRGFHDPRSLLEAVRQAPGDGHVVVSDQTMPGLTGLDLARALDEIRPELPVILCTGHSEALDEGVARAAGAEGPLMKPLTRARLARAVRAALDGRGGGCAPSTRSGGPAVQGPALDRMKPNEGGHGSES